MRTSCFTAKAALLSLFFTASALPAADEAPQLRYGWKTGQTHVYNVTIEADYGDYFEILSGTPLYQVTAADQDSIKLTTRGGLAEKQQLKPEKKGILLRGPRTPFSPFTGVGSTRGMELVINDRGEMISAKGSTQLPFLLGDLSLLMLDRLPKDAAKTWKHSRELSIVQAESGLPRPFARVDDRNVTKATMDITYTIDKVEDGTITVTRKVEMKTAEMVGGKPKIEIEGEGKLTFDRKLGCFSELDAKQKIVQRDADKWHETPLKISYKLLSEAEAKELSKKAEGTLLFPSEPLTEELQKQALADLKSGEKVKLLRTLSLLGNKDAKVEKEPTQVQKDIAKEIEKVLTGTDKTLHFSASRALAKWATKESIPQLVKNLESTETLTRHAAMDGLAMLKAEEGVEPIAKRLAELPDRLTARKALQAYGPKAEAEVLKMASHTEWAVRNEACNILGAIGTEKSVPTLTAMSQSDANALVKRNAKQAVEAIEKRK